MHEHFEPFGELKGLLTDIGIEDYFWAFRKIYKMAIKNGMRKNSLIPFLVCFPPGPSGPPPFLFLTCQEPSNKHLLVFVCVFLCFFGKDDSFHPEQSE